MRVAAYDVAAGCQRQSGLGCVGDSTAWACGGMMPDLNSTRRRG
jgi:hypothetical protein